MASSTIGGHDDVKNLLDELVSAVIEGRGDLPSDVRRVVERRSAELGGATAGGSDVPDELKILVDKVALHAYKTTDSDIQKLKEAGYSEDAIFEAIVAAAGKARKRHSCPTGRGLMRLRNVEEGHTEERKKFLQMMKEMIGREPPSVTKTTLYRPELFGAPFSALTSEAMRGDPEWAPGEPRALRRVHVPSQSVPLLNGRTRRGRVGRAGEGSRRSGLH